MCTSSILNFPECQISNFKVLNHTRIPLQIARSTCAAEDSATNFLIFLCLVSDDVSCVSADIIDISGSYVG